MSRSLIPGWKACIAGSSSGMEDETARKKYLEDILKDQIPAASELELTNKPDWSKRGTPLVADFSLQDSRLVFKCGEAGHAACWFFHRAREANF